MENRNENSSNLENKLDTLLAKAKNSNPHNLRESENITDVIVEEPEEEKKKCSGDCNCKCGDKE